MDWLETLPIAFLVVASGCVLAAQNIAPLRPLLNYGKCYRQSQGPLAWALNLTVPRSTFWHFYALSLGLCCYKIVHNGWNLRHALLVVQSARRFLEDWLLFSPSTGRMHVAHYLVGLCFYASETLATGFDKLETTSKVLKLVGLALFVIASLGQHSCHRALAKTQRYNFPEFPLKDVACPHYFFEVLIYTSLWLLSPTWPFAIMSVLWAHIILSASAAQSCKFYNAKGTTVRYSIYPYIK